MDLHLFDNLSHPKMSYSYKLDKTVAKFLSKRDCKFLRIFDKQMQKLCENPYRKDVDIQYYSE